MLRVIFCSRSLCNNLSGCDAVRTGYTEYTKQTARGFTIVELLIAILTTISIIAYNGIREQAYNVKIIANVKNYRQAIELYKVLNGSYPQTTPEIGGSHISVVCLGTGYADGACGRISGTDVYEDTALNGALSEITGSGGDMVNDKDMPSGPEAFVGAVYGNDITDSSRTGYSYARTIQYALHGANADCQLTWAWSYRLSDSPAVTACEIVLEGLEP